MKLMLIGNDVSIYIMYKSYNHQKQVEYGVVSWRFIPRLFRKHLLWFLSLIYPMSTATFPDCLNHSLLKVYRD